MPKINPRNPSCSQGPILDDITSRNHSMPNKCLTTRQRQIMELVVDGHPSKNIAADLGLSRRTVENHRASIMMKTGSTSIPALVRFSITAKLNEGLKTIV